MTNSQFNFICELVKKFRGKETQSLSIEIHKSDRENKSEFPFILKLSDFDGVIWESSVRDIEFSIVKIEEFLLRKITERFMKENE